MDTSVCSYCKREHEFTWSEETPEKAEMIMEDDE